MDTRDEDISAGPKLSDMFQSKRIRLQDYTYAYRKASNCNDETFVDYDDDEISRHCQHFMDTIFNLM